MSKLFKLFIVFNIYLGAIGANFLGHQDVAKTAFEESQKPVYTRDLQREWKSYAKKQLEKSTGLEVLLPLGNLMDYFSDPIWELRK